MNTRQYSMPADRQAINQRARETARRRGAYQAIDGAYSAGLITETARELAKWYVRHCCGMRSYHDLTQAAQAQQFGVSRRTIITLVQQLVAADLIWLELHGTRNRTFITAYQAPPTDDVDGTDAPSALASDVETPAYQQWRVAADAALAAGDTARAAMYEYQAAMELARLSNCTAVPVFGDWNGDPAITLNVQSGSPSPVNKDSGIPTGDTESSVCITDDDGGSAPRPAYQATLTIPDTEATRLLQALGVRSPATLRKHASAPPELIRRAEQRRAALGYTTGLIGRILDDGGVIWGTCGQLVENQASALQDDRDAGHAKYIRGPLSKYIKTGLEDPLPSNTEPANDPELARYRGRGMPWWGDGGAP